MKPLPVSAHAVLRYLTRVEKFDLRPIVKRLGRDAGNVAMAYEAAAALGVPLSKLERRICPDHLVSAVMGGAGRIRRQGFVLICRDGVVVTVEEDVQLYRARMLSRQELKRMRQRQDRRRQ